MPKKMQKYCSILQFLEDNDKDLHEVFHRLCVGSILRPRGKANGITFLYPKDAKYRKEIIKEAFGDNPEKALQMLRAITIQDYLPETSDFITRKDDIPNSLVQRVEVTSADAKTVKLTAGLTLTKNTKFTPMEGRKLCVYDMSGAKRMPLDGKPTAWSYSQRNPNKKVGGVEQIKKMSIHEMVQSDLRECVNKPKQNPFAERCLSFMKYACKDSCSVELAKCLKPVPEMTYLCLLAYWEKHYSEFNDWASKTDGLYKPEDTNSHKGNVHKEYLRVYEKCVEVYYKGKDYKQVHSERRAERAKVADKLGAHSTVAALREKDACALWCDELPIVSLIPVMEIIKRNNCKLAASIMNDLYMSLVKTRPKSESDYEGTFVGRSFKGDVALYLSSTLALVRSNAYHYSPLKQEDANNSEDGDPKMCFVDSDGNVESSLFNVMGKLFNAQNSRNEVPCALGKV